MAVFHRDRLFNTEFICRDSNIKTATENWFQFNDLGKLRTFIAHMASN